MTPGLPWRQLGQHAWIVDSRDLPFGDRQQNMWNNFHKQRGNSFEKMTDDEKAALQAACRCSYGGAVDVLAKISGRNETATGVIYDGYRSMGMVAPSYFFSVTGLAGVYELISAKILHLSEEDRHTGRKRARGIIFHPAAYRNQQHVTGATTICAVDADLKNPHEFDELLGWLDQLDLTYLAFPSASASEEEPRLHILLVGTRAMNPSELKKGYRGLLDRIVPAHLRDRIDDSVCRAEHLMYLTAPQALWGHPEFGLRWRMGRSEWADLLASENLPGSPESRETSGEGTHLSLQQIFERHALGIAEDEKEIVRQAWPLPPDPVNCHGSRYWIAMFATCRLATDGSDENTARAYLRRLARNLEQTKPNTRWRFEALWTLYLETKSKFAAKP